MTEYIQGPDPPLIAEEEAKVALLSREDIQRIDQALLSQACERWHKVARVVGFAMRELEDRVVGIPDVYYSQRVCNLVDEGYLESQGNLRYMAYS